VENGLTLDLNRLISQRDILPGRHISGSLIWSDSQSGKKIASIDFEASLVSQGHACEVDWENWTDRRRARRAPQWNENMASLRSRR
jgi:hypothetical protein